jgi:hypothetical protein
VIVHQHLYTKSGGKRVGSKRHQHQQLYIKKRKKEQAASSKQQAACSEDQHGNILHIYMKSSSMSRQQAVKKWQHQHKHKYQHQQFHLGYD